MDILKKAGKLGKLASDILENHREPLIIALKDNFNKDSIANLRKGEIVISREMLRYHISRALAQEPSADLDFIACTDSGVKIGLLIKKFKTCVTAEIGMSIKKAVITSVDQEIVIKISNENVTGNNLSGKLVSALAGTIISGFIKKAIISVDVPIHYNKKHNIAVIQLNKVKAIKRMKKPVWGQKSVLDFISITEAVHTDSGIVLKCKVKIF